ncbi:uncharacterized protein LOC126738524 [Anthonomus grandis grandis]|uniref:uncharacterized protein LOC126738524 n=1 Tax=Anthonomus grandis grandis TaxID=2921223 RepID=UPI002165BD59|nr:uncharacterized protein LOC126738524 [Anthonomus grandis grandis]
MSFVESDRIYYPEEYDYSAYYQNELQKYKNPPIYAGSPNLNDKLKRKLFLPTAVNYFNERKCPIYVHHIKKNSSVYNHYNQNFITSKKPVEPKKSHDVQKNSKFVLDKLEETYWATWKPKKELDQRSPRKNSNFQQNNPFYPLRKVHPHGDTGENVIFQAKNFESSSTANSIHETYSRKPPKHNVAENKEERKLERPSKSRKPKNLKNGLITQEIQTLVHCPVILEESKDEPEKLPTEPERLSKERLASKEMLINVTEYNTETNKKITKKTKKSKTKTNKKKSKHTSAKSKTAEPEYNKMETLSGSEIDITADSINTFVEHKDSIEITKKKQEAEGPKEHFQQPKCIRLYRKPAAGYIKGGSYPLKSCLKKETTATGHSFMLGPPGSPMFITSNSFAVKKKK